MQLRVTFLVNVLLCCLICTCKGTPPKHEKSKQKINNYTETEDQFLFDELVSVLDGSTPVFAREVWQKVAEEHTKKSKAHTKGFPKERTFASLRNRFRDILYKRFSNLPTVPEILMRKIIQGQSHQVVQGRTYKNAYTTEENDFIFKELQKPSVSKLFGKSTLEAIRQEHDRKRLANTKGFLRARSLRSLSCQLSRLKQTNQLPQEVLQNLQLLDEDTNFPYNTGASSSTSAAQNEPTDLQSNQETIDEELEEDEEYCDIFQAILENPIIEDDEFSKHK